MRSVTYSAEEAQAELTRRERLDRLAAARARLRARPVPDPETPPGTAARKAHRRDVTRVNYVKQGVAATTALRAALYSRNSVA
jgi:hypothetical protein